jgi:phytoene dehydrogenase-like protein
MPVACFERASFGFSGAVVTSADVQQVLVRDGKAAGVRLASGQEINSDMVSNVSWTMGSDCQRAQL